MLNFIKQKELCVKNSFTGLTKCQKCAIIYVYLSSRDSLVGTRPASSLLGKRPMTTTFTLPIPQRAQVVIPDGCTLVEPGQPKLTPTTPEIKITTTKVHVWCGDRMTPLDMIRRAIKEGQSPIDSVPDLEEVLTRCLNIDVHHLVTGIKLDGPSGENYLCLDRQGAQWIASACPICSHGLNGSYQVL